MKKLRCYLFTFIGLIGLLLCMNENANYLNCIGLLLLGLAMLLGALNAKDEFTPIVWIKGLFNRYLDFVENHWSN